MEQLRTIKIYIHKNLVNNKMYVGQTIEDNPKDRWDDGFDRTYNQHLRAAYKKYGKNNFKSTIVNEVNTQEEADLLEQFYIKKYDLLDPAKGYNKTDGGKYFTTLSEETKKKIGNSIRNSKNFLENNYLSHHRPVIGMKIDNGEIYKFDSQKDAGAFFNIVPSAIGNCCLGRIKSAANIVWKYDDENFKGFDRDEVRNIRKCSDERKKKISLSQKGRPGKITRSTPVIGFNIETEEYKSFDTSIDAARMLSKHLVKVNDISDLKYRITGNWVFFRKDTFGNTILTDEIKAALKKQLHDPRRKISEEGLRKIKDGIKEYYKKK